MVFPPTGPRPKHPTNTLHGGWYSLPLPWVRGTPLQTRRLETGILITSRQTAVHGQQQERQSCTNQPSHTRYDPQTPTVSRLRARRSDGRRTAPVLSRYQSVEQSIRALSIIPAVWSGIDFREPRSRPITTPAPASNAPPSSERCRLSPLQPRLVHSDYERIKCAVVLSCCTADNPPSPGLAALKSLIQIQPRRLLHSFMSLTHTRLRWQWRNFFIPYLRQRLPHRDNVETALPLDPASIRSHWTVFRCVDHSSPFRFH